MTVFKKITCLLNLINSFFCSDYGVYTLVTLCMFLVWYAFGMGATPWTINGKVDSYLFVEQI